MGTQRPPFEVPLPRKPLRVVRNGWAPKASMGNVLQGYNHVVAHRRKCFFTKALHLGALPSGSASSLTTWRSYVRTGYAASGALNLVFDMLVAPGDNGSAGDPYCYWDVGGSSTDEIHPGVYAKTIGPQHLRREQIRYAVSANTAYELALKVEDYCVPVACSIYEEHSPIFADGDTGISQPDLIHSAEAHITDDQHSQLLLNGHNLWLANAAPVLSWCTDGDPDNGADVPTRSTASLANLFDQTVTSVATTSIGYGADVRWHQPDHTGDVACVFAAYGKNASTAGGQVDLVDSSGSLVSLSSFSTAGEWKTGTCVLDGTSTIHRCDVQFAGDGSNNFQVYAVALYEYAT